VTTSESEQKQNTESHPFLTSYSHVHSHLGKSLTLSSTPYKPTDKTDLESHTPSPGHPMAERSTGGRSSRSTRRIPKPADLRDLL
jgi:hypothetical protein